MRNINTLGSITFGTNVVKTDEYLLLAKTMTENGQSVQETDLQIRAIDDMLGMQRMQSIINRQRFTPSGRIRKDSSLTDMLSNRIDQLVDQMKESGIELPKGGTE